jgi:hypothetical protein
MAEEVSKAIEADKEYKAKCIARAKEARQAVASAHLVGATPRKVVEETEEELAGLEKDEQPAAIRPNLDMATIGNEKPVLCWDTETAGLGKPGICQLAYVLVKTDGEVVCYDKVWKLPAGVFMSKDAQKIHGITTEKTRGGADPGAELLHFWNLAQQVLGEGGVVLGHNIHFDCRAFNFTASAWGLPNTLEHGHMLDTMRLSKQYSPLQTAKGYQKAFKNDELCKRSLPTGEHYVCVLICVRVHRRQAPLGPLPRLGAAAFGARRRSRIVAQLPGGQATELVVDTLQSQHDPRQQGVCWAILFDTRSIKSVWFQSSHNPRVSEHADRLVRCVSGWDPVTL